VPTKKGRILVAEKLRMRFSVFASSRQQNQSKAIYPTAIQRKTFIGETEKVKLGFVAKKWLYKCSNKK
jgi:hypothetical protein